MYFGFGSLQVLGDLEFSLFEYMVMSQLLLDAPLQRLQTWVTEQLESWLTPLLWTCFLAPSCVNFPFISRVTLLFTLNYSLMPLRHFKPITVSSPHYRHTQQHYHSHHQHHSWSLPLTWSSVTTIMVVNQYIPFTIRHYQLGLNVYSKWFKN